MYTQNPSPQYLAAIEQIQDDLRTAMSIELTTIPTYLYAYFSIRKNDAGGSFKADQTAKIILSVIDEEMLHMGLVSNVLNAIGGTPTITTAPYIPHYPGPLIRHSKVAPVKNFEVRLLPLSLESIQLFLDIELPGYEDPDPEPPTTKNWETIGQFYAGVEQELKENTSLQYDHGRQLPSWTNPGAGQMIQVTSQHDALRALDLIVEQGEGLGKEKHDDGDHELAHYWKFKEVQSWIENGTIDLERDTYPVIPNPDASQYNEEQRQHNTSFNSVYSNLLDALQESFSSEAPDVFKATKNFKAPVRYMDEMGRLAAVMRNSGPVKGSKYVPGPTFEYIPLSDRTS